MSYFLSSANFSQTEACSFNNSNVSVADTAWRVTDIVNPVALFVDENTFCQYANASICYTNDFNSGAFGRILQPFCIDLLPFCIFFSFLRVIVSIINFVFIYKKKIDYRLSRIRDSHHSEGTMASSQTNYTIRFKSLLRNSFIIDMVSAVISLWLFKGYQYYASQYNTNNASHLALVGNFDMDKDIWRALLLFSGVFIWFSCECAKVYVQIFSVSTLTHIDNLKKQSQRQQERLFYKKHTRFAFYWTLVLFSIGIALLTTSFFGGPDYRGYKLHYRFYSSYTIAFWISYTLIFIFILTDRILAYDGFKERQQFLKEEKSKKVGVGPTSSNSNNIHLSSYQLSRASRAYTNLEQAIRRKFPNKPIVDVQEITAKLAVRYNSRMKEHLNSLKDKLKSEMDEPVVVSPTSMRYAKFIRFFNVLNLIGYAVIMMSYRDDDPSTYLVGFIVCSMATFAQELVHNYLLYRSFFLQVVARMNRDEDSG